jgi:hypothetical protein
LALTFLSFESTIAICSGEGPDDLLLLINVELGEERVIDEFDVMQVLEVVAPVAILLCNGCFGDCFILGSLSSCRQL